MNDEILTVACPCGNRMKVRASSIGKKVRCPQCQAITLIARPDSTEPASETPAAPASDPAPAPKPEPARPKKPTKIETTTQLKAAKPKETQPKAAKPKPAQTKPAEPKAAEPKPADRKKPKRKSSEPKAPVSVPDVAISDPPETAPDFSALTIAEDDSTGASDEVPVIPEIKTDAPTPVSSARDTTPEIKLQEAKPAPKVTVGKPRPKSQASDTETIPSVNEMAPRDDASEATASAIRGGSRDHTGPRTYPTLEWIGKLYKVLGVLWLVLTGAASLLPLISITQGGSLLLIVPSVLGGLCAAILGAVTLFAASELIRVVLDIQDNTHRSSLR